MKALALLRPTIENIQMLARVVFRSRLGGHLKMRLDQIGGFDQHGGGALLAVFIDHNPQALKIAPVHRPLDAACRGLVACLLYTSRCV